MATLTLDEIEARAARFHAAEGERNAPTPSAIRAVYALTSALTDVINLDPEGWHDVRRILVEELAAVEEQAERHHDAVTLFDRCGKCGAVLNVDGTCPVAWEEAK